MFEVLGPRKRCSWQSRVSRRRDRRVIKEKWCKLAVKAKNPKSKTLTHLDEKGKAKMVDVGDKPVVERIAVARGFIRLAKETIKLIKSNKVKKGDVLAVARIAGIQAAKKTSELIPLCHPLAIDVIDIDLQYQQKGLAIEATVRSTGKTGVEMEALTAVAVAALTIYDMCKAVDKKMRIGEIYLWRKSKTLSNVEGSKRSA